MYSGVSVATMKSPTSSASTPASASAARAAFSAKSAVVSGMPRRRAMWRARMPIFASRRPASKLIPARRASSSLPMASPGRVDARCQNLVRLCHAASFSRSSRRIRGRGSRRLSQRPRGRSTE